MEIRDRECNNRERHKILRAQECRVGNQKQVGCECQEDGFLEKVTVRTSLCRRQGSNRVRRILPIEGTPESVGPDTGQHMNAGE